MDDIKNIKFAVAEADWDLKKKDLEVENLEC